MNSVVHDASTLGLVAVVVLYLVIAFAISTSRLRPAIKWLLWGGLALRVYGAVLREGMKADAAKYYRFGTYHSKRFSEFDFSPFWDPDQFFASTWIGSNVVTYPAGMMITILGQNIFAIFLMYTLLGYLGLVLYMKAFRNGLPAASDTGYVAWLCLFPSLWFWPSSIGKEALMTLGLGLAVFGYLRSDKRTKWFVLALGLGLVFSIRPQVVAVFAMAVVLTTFLDFKQWTPVRVLQGLVLLVLGGVAMWYSLQFALETDGASDIEDYISTNASLSTQGGSEVGAASLSPLGVLGAIMNVLFRPFLWEAHNLAALFAAIEVLAMWLILFLRRRKIAAAFRIWRSHRALRFAVVFTALYVVALGMNLGNLGIIARQRVLMFPLFFVIVEAGTMAAAAEESKRFVRNTVSSRFTSGLNRRRPQPT